MTPKKSSLSRSPGARKKLSYLSYLNSEPHRPLMEAAWQNSQGIECKQIIGPNRCFCTHSFQCHQNPKTINSTFCMVPGCKCKCYSYVPYFDIKCMCRHSYKEHDRNTKKCRMCDKCLGFITNWCCRCGIKYELHQTVFKQRKHKNSMISNNQRATIETQKSRTLQLQPHCSPTVPIDTNFHEQLQKSRASAQSRHNFQKQEKLYKKYQREHEQCYESHFEEVDENDLLFQQRKRKQISRINQKYSTLSFQRQVENSNESSILGLSGVRRPELARRVTALELLIRPHNYCYVPLQKFLQKVYQKSDTNKQTQK